ncbi:uncharacterized protein LOC132174433 [Corylus avellana]|uniref:uncharacterized protein LOC132174433 n=1 Tax=Corylus avellana TaxID=13451 RepID=UPI001E229D25|nr:uncharacterized protein LOC132174433 [Corylus avellana]
MEDPIEPENGNGKQANKKPLDVMFKEAVSVSLCENAESSESKGENSALKSRLRELEREVRRLKANSRVGNKGLKKSKDKGLYAVFMNQEGCKEGYEERGEEPEESVEDKRLKKSKGKGLYAAFTNPKGSEEGCEERGEELEESVENKGLMKSKGKSLHATFTNQEACKEWCEERRREEPKVFKEFLPDMEVFASHLYMEGYFNDANFLRANKLEFDYFESHYGRGYMRFAAEKFGKDYQETAK